MPDNSKKKYGLPIGRQGKMNTDPITELMQENRLREQEQKLKRQSEIDELKHLSEKKELQGKLSGEDKARMAELEEQLTKTKDELAAERQRTLESKIEEYQRQVMELAQGDPKLKEMQNKLDEVRAERDQERLNQLKSEIAKLREEGGLDITKELEKIEPLMEKLGYKKETATSSAIPPDIWIQIKQMEINQDMERLKAESEREDRKDAREFEKLKWAEERDMKSAQAQAELAAKKETNELIASGLGELRQVIAAAMSGRGAGAGAGAITDRIQAGEGEAGGTVCPNCQTAIPVSESDTDVICAGCGAQYTIERTPNEPVEAGKGRKK